MSTTRSGEFTIKRATLVEKGFEYQTFKVSGWLNGQRVRKQFKSREEAVGAVNALQVQAANADGAIRTAITRLTESQVAQAEAAFARIGDRPLSTIVDWYFATYKAPIVGKPLIGATAEFLADRTPHVRARQLRDYKDTLRLLASSSPITNVDAFTTADILAFIRGRNAGKKRFNNLRGDLAAFFTFCQSAPREWCRNNPVASIDKFKISRGVPEILSADTCAKLMEFLESYSGGVRSKHKPGFLVPYFSLCLFAGLRPSTRDGEIRRLAEVTNLEKHLDVELGVIRVSPEISKVKDVRQVTIQPNLREWLLRYPLKEYPIFAPNMDELLATIRKKFAIGGDVARHTFISMHVAKFRSMGDAALQAGNSESMIKKHYLNMVSEADAQAFWSIVPKCSA